MNHAYGLGGVYSTQSASMSAPSRLWNSLAAPVTAWIALSRSTGSAMSVRSDVNRLDTRLPLSRGPAAGASVATGTPATSALTGHARPLSARCAAERPGDEAEHDVVHGDAEGRAAPP